MVVLLICVSTHFFFISDGVMFWSRMWSNRILIGIIGHSQRGTSHYFWNIQTPVFQIVKPISFNVIPCTWNFESHWTLNIREVGITNGAVHLTAAWYVDIGRFGACFRRRMTFRPLTPEVCHLRFVHNIGNNITFVWWRCTPFVPSLSAVCTINFVFIKCVYIIKCWFHCMCLGFHTRTLYDLFIYCSNY